MRQLDHKKQTTIRLTHLNEADLKEIKMSGTSQSARPGEATHDEAADEAASPQ